MHFFFVTIFAFNTSHSSSKKALITPLINIKGVFEYIFDIHTTLIYLMLCTVTLEHMLCALIKIFIYFSLK